MASALFLKSPKREHPRARWLFAGMLGAAAWVIAANVLAQYPNRPLRYIVPQAPGSASDTSARIVAFELTRILGQQVIIDNRPGGGLTIGIDMVVRASPDGYTMGYGNIGGLAINRIILPKVPYDSLKDVQPIAQTNTGNQLLAVTNSLPVKSVRELIVYAKANPGKLLNGSSGNGTPGHLAGELFKQMANVSIMHVPYKGGAQAMTEMMTGQVQLIFESTSSIAAHMRTGRLRGIAVTGVKRTPSFPDIPTIAESGVPGYDVTVWAGLITPVGVSKAVIAKLNAAVNEAMASPGLIEKYAANGTETVRSTPEEFGVLIRREVEKYAALGKTVKVKVD
ncbi:MAG TPA: tripartite tricarboxylate transporter substrate binding protein [Burkholderiales bacterium]|nr:tripartite tricarboxylate transporter substrate binding protein [Burkholderiales bacterium]